MRVLHINTSDWGDETAVAANRLADALKNNGIKAKMLVRHKRTEQITVARLPQSPLSGIRTLCGNLSAWKTNRIRKSTGCRLDTADTGTDITSQPEFKEADIIHLHDTTDGLLSLKDIRSIIDSGKPVVWTLHDVWPFTGICHHNGTCTAYRTACSRCPMLNGQGKEHDLSTAVFKRKQQMLRGAHILFVASTGWLEKAARQSALLTGQEIVCIPNTICTHTFHPEGQKAARLAFNLPADKKLLLFRTSPTGTQQAEYDTMAETCRILKETMGEEAEGIGIVVTGKDAELSGTALPFPVYTVEDIKDDKQLAKLYNAADAVVATSCEGGQSGLLMEAMACGVPCVGFDTGDFTEIITHKQNGFLAKPHHPEELAEGIRFVLDTDVHGQLSSQAVHKVLSDFGETHIASRYIALYHRITNKR